MRVINVISKSVILTVCVSAALLLYACEESSGPDNNIDPNPHFVAEHSFGKVTVLFDIAYKSYPLYRFVAVGYRDSLGNGNREAVIAVFSGGARFEYKEIINDNRINSVNVVKYDEYTRSFIAASEGETSAPTFHRIRPKDSIIQHYHVPYRGDVVHPTEIVAAGNGNAVISGWTQTGETTRGFVVMVDSTGSLVWERYYEEPGVDVRIMDMLKSEEEIVVACSCDIIQADSISMRSELIKLDYQGSTRSAIDVLIPDFAIEEFEGNIDSGYAYIVAGRTAPNKTISSIGFIGLIGEQGNLVWSADLREDSLFSVVSLIRLIYHYEIYGHVLDRTAGFSVSEKNTTGFTITGGSSESNPKNLRYVKIRYSGGLILTSGLYYVSYNASGELTNAVAVIAG